MFVRIILKVAIRDGWARESGAIAMKRQQNC